MKNNIKAGALLKILIAALFLTIPFCVFSQPTNWQNLDLNNDNIFGVSTERAYQELLKKKKATKVKVAVLDSGIDILHEDLKKVIFTNKKEKLNGKDDDGNGYVDDRNGWSFLGSEKGNINHETLEITRLVREKQKKFSGRDSASITAQERGEFEEYQKLKKELERRLGEARLNLMGVSGMKNAVKKLVEKTGKENPKAEDLKALKPENQMEEYLINMVSSQLESQNINEVYASLFDRAIEYYQNQADYHLNLEFDPRDIVGDNENDPTERFYGNADVIGPDALHGTHVAGIIGAVRNNKKGIKGVASKVEIISVRCVPDGDERDKDIANSIRYATDQGAKIINMSFGKGYSPDKDVVDEAVKYAMSKDVLLIHAAGNDNKNLDEEDNYPTKFLNDGTTAAAWLEVGASAWVSDSTLKASFSNYGKTKVDVFAPGVSINSTAPGSKYEVQSGTSMAAPVVAGVAALIRSYYPHLSAVQVKDIIMKSAVKVNHNVSFKKGQETVSVPFSELSVTGAVVNAYEAIKLAETYK